jgi:glutamyl-tRNA(Gln) amidotransferase subunit E
MVEDPSSAEQVVEPIGDFNPRTDAPLDFPDAEFGALSRGDYEALGFMCGLEVHQQLLTDSKLFCRCPTGRFPKHHDAEVLRHMRPTLSELGEYDGTALMEFKTRKEIVYQLERNSVCTYETDDTPPFEIDDSAIRIAIEVAELLGLNLVSEIHVMRKQYLDGSIPTGFQRTAMIGLDGSVPFRVPELGIDRTLRIRQLSLEEDSCREVSDVGHRITFSTGRLGMPLIETVTEPELFTPLEVEAAGRLLADIARATGKVRRGPGAARQDVNVSVAGSRRVEIKGVARHRGLPRLVHVEAFRQLNLLRVREELLRRGVTPEDLALPPDGRPWEVSRVVGDVGSVVRRGQDGPVREAAERGETVCAVRLRGFAGVLGHPTQPGRTFSHEIYERVRVIACPDHHPFMTHTDDSDGLVGDAGWREIRTAVDADPGDAVVLVWASANDAETAAREVMIRAREALVGIPSETRQAHDDGTTGFERILPGPDRMYPDTDTPPLPIPDTTVEAIRVTLPEHPIEREERYRALGLEGRLAHRLARSPWATLFDAAAPEDGGTAARLAWFAVDRMRHHVRRAGAPPMCDPKRLETMIASVSSGEIRPEALPRMLDAAVAESDQPAEAIVDRFRSPEDPDGSLRSVLEATVKQAQALEGRAPDTRLRWAMGQAMRSLVGRVDPGEVHAALARALVGEDEGALT